MTSSHDNSPLGDRGTPWSDDFSAPSEAPPDDYPVNEPTTTPELQERAPQAHHSPRARRRLCTSCLEAYQRGSRVCPQPLKLRGEPDDGSSGSWSGYVSMGPYEGRCVACGANPGESVQQEESPGVAVMCAVGVILTVCWSGLVWDCLRRYNPPDY